ncbi:hypothetical protein P7H41_12860 [Vagococcus fluvialis]|uniref:hypothetical protein n=1 Tax=Vagococcus fluvialis TaxID=2738 RepID=UPI00288E3937|nr:hypothetical protein [Vagococcus fluvialis]MDT2782832.1 hypothetical protein [Vagococcus fluvialis]
MTRQYMNVRLSYEAKYCIEKIQTKIQNELDLAISANDLDEIEQLTRNYLINKDPILSSVSITNILKVSSSSIVEEACNFTWNYSLKDWEHIEIKMNNYIFKENLDVGTLTPRLYLDEKTQQRIQEYQKTFMKDSMVRVVKNSYVIKLIVFAYFLHIFK